MSWAITVETGTSPGMIPGAWEDVTSRLLAAPIEIAYGRTDEQALDEAGTATLLLDNHDGKWDAGILPNTAVRIRATVGAQTRPLFYGLVESAPARWPANGNDNVVAASLTDARGRLARAEGIVDLPRQLSGARVAALLDAAGWPSGLRDLDPGVVRIEPSDPEQPINILAAIRETVEAEDGTMWLAGDGTFTFRDRHSRLDSPTVVTLDPATDYVYVNLDADYDDSRLWTAAQAEMADGRTYEVVDEQAAGQFGYRWDTIRDLPVPPVEAEAAAGWVVYRYSTPRRRFSVLAVEAALSDEARDTVLTLEPGSLVRIVHRPPNGATVDELVHVERVRHQVSADMWRTVYELSPYFGAGPWIVLDDPVLGLLDGDNKLAP